MTSVDPARLIRRALRVNAVFSATCGGAFMAAGQVLAPVLGLPPAVLRIFGALVAAFGVHAWLASGRKSVSPAEATYLVGGDVAYVLASVIVLAGWPHLLSAAGRVFFAVAAGLVAVLGFVESVGLRRLTRPKAALPA
jgi:hypothetical protein